jgi:hypothetical protein
MKISLTAEDLQLIQKSLMAHRWKVEAESGQTDPEFSKTAQIMDKLSAPNNGATVEFKSSK